MRGASAPPPSAGSWRRARASASPTSTRPGGRALADALGDAALFLRCDHGNADDCSAAVAAVVARWGQLDILFNNAGIGWTGTFDEVADRDVAEVTRANLVGPLR